MRVHTADDRHYVLFSQAEVQDIPGRGLPKRQGVRLVFSLNGTHLSTTPAGVAGTGHQQLLRCARKALQQR